MMLSKKGQTLYPLLKRFFRVGSPGRKQLISPWDLATGIERWEAIEFGKGNIDPFYILPVKRGPGTKECPNIVPSPWNKRVVGCKCEKDSINIVWWWIHEGFPRRCDCNYWFVLERFELPKIYEDE